MKATNQGSCSSTSAGIDGFSNGSLIQAATGQEWIEETRTIGTRLALTPVAPGA